MGLDNRIGPKFLHAGPGYGGSCFPKDTRALVESSKSAGYSFNILESVIEVNDRQPLLMAEKIEKPLNGLKGKKLAVLGLSFKPNTDDIRESPAIIIVKELQKKGAAVCAFDPVAMESARKELDGVAFGQNAYEVMEDADALVIITEWNEFRNLDWARVKELISTPVLFDLRNIYEPEKMEKLGFQYHCVGRR
jgi:UDPglucose 6-dehydrogenase